MSTYNITNTIFKEIVTDLIKETEKEIQEINKEVDIISAGTK